MIFLYYILGIIIGVIGCIVFQKFFAKSYTEGIVKFDIYNEDCPVVVKFTKDVGYLMSLKTIKLKVDNTSNIIYNPYNDKS